MDNLTSQLLRASFGGIEFFVTTETQSQGGRKIAIHDYVNSNESFIEDLGQFPPRFKINAFVHGVDFLARAKSLENVLNKKGSQLLVLPTLGSMTAYALPYTKRASQKSVGEIVFNLEFATGRPVAGPTASAVDSEQVYALGDKTRQSVQNNFAQLWQVPTTSADSAVAISDILDSLSVITEGYSSILSSENLSKVNNKIEFISSTISELIREPNALSSNLIGGTPTNAGAWQELSIGLTGGLGLPNLLASTIFGNKLITNRSGVRGDSVDNNPNQSGISTIPLWESNTAQRISRNTNRLNVVNLHRILSLINAYEVAADTKYSTQNQINNTRFLLEAEYIKLMLDDTEDIKIIQSEDETRVAVENLRAASLKVLEQKEQEVFLLTTKTLNIDIPVFVQTYNLYAEVLLNEMELEDKTINVRSLNPEKQSIALIDEINIFRTS